MCGIAGSINYNNSDFAIKQLHHRGPDSFGKWSSDNVELVHLRLAIIDLTKSGHQPMTFKNWTISFNGEIYNYLEIKKELVALGSTFLSNSDTEVILHAIDTWGIEAALLKFNGMWAIALYNTQTKLLYLCRDKIGKKPIHYTLQNNKFLFASEIKAFPAEFIGKPKPESVIRFLSTGFVPHPNSYFENIYKLPPASYLVINSDTLLLTINKYWSIPTTINYDITYNDAVLETEKIIESSIKYRLMADVEVGTFLSGGIDSSLITALAQKHSTKQIKTFSIGFDLDKYDESKYAKQIATYLNTDHQEYIFGSKDILDLFIPYCKNVDEPFGDSAILPTMLLSKMTKEKVTVALSGDGGDELFAGYSRYFFTKKYYSLFNKLPFILRKIISEILPILNKNIGNKLKFPIISNNLDNYYSILYLAIKPWELANIFQAEYIMEAKIDFSLQSLLAVKESLMANDIIGSAMKLDASQNLPEMMLHKVDRATMQFSLEARAPLLDYRLIEYAFQLPTNIKTNNNKSKPILKDVLAKHIPIKMFNRPKSGFTVPLKEWFQNELKNELLNKINSLDPNIFNKSVILSLYTDHQLNKINYQSLFFNLLQLK
jgi:asparagine synthase (glutamine-hydrolysing)